MEFIGRVDDLKKLEKQLSIEELSFSLIYGRRRVGKSELVKQLLKNTDVKSIYFECKQVAEESNVKSLSQVVSEVLALPKLGYTDIESQVQNVGVNSLSVSPFFKPPAPVLVWPARRPN